MSVFLTSDLHFGHHNIIPYCRPHWDTVDDMNADLIYNWNATVKPHDTVWILGDLVMGHRDQTLPLVGRLNGYKLLVPGNHDGKLWPKKNMAMLARYAEQGVMVMDKECDMYLHSLDLRVDLCHFPYSGDHTEDDRYLEHRPVDRGRWLLHGHVHDGWKFDGENRQINVGVDVWDYRPVHVDQITDLIQGKE